MNRRNLIKSIPFLGIAPLAVADQKCSPWPLECSLAPFQQKIWEAYNEHQNNIFIMPPKSGKTFMFNRLYEIETERKVASCLVDWDERACGNFISLVLNLAGSTTFKSTYFALPPIFNLSSFEKAIGSGHYNVLEFTKEDVKPFG